MNTIAQMKTVPVTGANGPATAIMVAVNILDEASADDFVSHVAEQFKLQRTVSPPDTSLLLITIIGPMTAERFAARWRDVQSRDVILNVYMSSMAVADVVQGTSTGQQLSRTSLVSRS